MDELDAFFFEDRDPYGIGSNKSINIVMKSKTLIEKNPKATYTVNKYETSNIEGAKIEQ